MISALPAGKWNFSTAAHLLNRAGFGGSPSEIHTLARLSTVQAVDRIMAGSPGAEPRSLPRAATEMAGDRRERMKEYRSAAPEERQKLRREDQRAQRELVVDLREWWLQRMVTSSSPFQEKLTLFWHGHFATSVQKVKQARLMWAQNDLFRQHGAGSWPALLTRVSQDPAMLLWLDQAQSRKQHPNENYARELMELFTLGEGNYTEKDVMEAARALTGWSYDRLNERFADRPMLHDAGRKTILGKTGNFNGDDLINLIVAHPQSSRYISARLWNFYAGELPSPQVNEWLASVFKQSNYRFAPLLKAMFLSNAFYAPSVIRNQVKSPVHWLVNSVRLLERPLPPPQVAHGVLRTLGQELFAPPNVKGWDGGIGWITTNNLLTRYNFATFLVTGQNPLRNVPMRGMKGKKGKKGTRTFASAAPVAVDKLLTTKQQTDKAKLLAALEERFVNGYLRPKQRAVLEEYLDNQAELDHDDLLHAIRLVMCTPEFQLA